MVSRRGVGSCPAGLPREEVVENPGTFVESVASVVRKQMPVAWTGTRCRSRGIGGFEMKKMFAAGALVAALGLVTSATAQTVKSRGPARLHDKMKMVPLPPSQVEVAPQTLYWPEGYQPDSRDLRAVQTIYDNSNTGTVYNYGGEVAGAIAYNGALEGVQFGTNWIVGSNVTQVNLCVKRIAASAQTFKILVKVWDTVNAAGNGGPGTDVKSAQLLGNFFYANGGAGFNITGAFTVGYNLA